MIKQDRTHEQLVAYFHQTEIRLRAQREDALLEGATKAAMFYEDEILHNDRALAKIVRGVYK